MAKFETLPVERSASIISSIINLVCPQCGGSMMEFQCNGRCARNWLPGVGGLYDHAVGWCRLSQNETVKQKLLGETIWQSPSALV